MSAQDVLAPQRTASDSPAEVEADGPVAAGGRDAAGGSDEVDEQEVHDQPATTDGGQPGEGLSQHETAGDGPAPGVPRAAVSELTAERDRYLDLLRRVQAEFDNCRKRVRRDRDDDAARVTGEVLTRLLPALDAVDAAAEHHGEVVGPIRSVLTGSLAQAGLERLSPRGEAFDPALHEAVERDGDALGDVPVVAEVLRPGYRFKGRLLRPAMVRVTG